MRYLPRVRALVRVPQDGNGKPSVAHDAVRISPEEYALLTSLKVQLDSMRKKQAELQKELALLTADIYRKDDELTASLLQVAEKYGLKKGEREMDFATGEIVTLKKGKTDGA